MTVIYANSSCYKRDVFLESRSLSVTLFKKRRLEVFTPMKIQVMVFWVVTPCSNMVGYQRFEGFSYLHFQGEINTEAAWPSSVIS
jgi:hypothetical protein